MAHITENDQTRIQILPHFPRVYLLKNKQQTPLYSVTVGSSVEKILRISVLT